MRVSLSLRRLAAVLCAVLLPFGHPQEGVRAQSTGAGVVRTVTNIAEASWDAGDTRRGITSNPVSFDVTGAPASPPSIRVFRRSPGNGGDDLVYQIGRAHV